MNAALKYVILRPHTDEGFTVPVFGVAPFTHKQIADAFARTHAPIAAGFCEPLATGGWRTYGSSTSLCLTPGADDAKLIGAFTRAQFKTAA
jgi:hypothetical protein